MAKFFGFLIVFSSFLFSEMPRNHCRYLALTFDDGPRRTFLEKILPYLKEEGIRATFFVIGGEIKGNEDLIKKLAADSYEIENHTWSHPNLTKISLEKAIEEVTKTSVLIDFLIGRQPKFLRPPYFAQNEKLRKEFEKKGVRMLIHGKNSIGSLDWVYTKEPEEIVSWVKKVAETRGEIDYVIVFHELQNTLKALPEVIRYFREKGYIFVTLEEFVKLSPNADI